MEMERLRGRRSRVRRRKAMRTMAATAWAEEGRNAPRHRSGRLGSMATATATNGG
jgi:hypothetical protein